MTTTSRPKVYMTLDQDWEYPTGTVNPLGTELQLPEADADRAARDGCATKPPNGWPTFSVGNPR